jgi:hypothetical protein
VKEKFYPFRASEDYLFYYFESRSEERTIAKAIEFAQIGQNTYNLAFGDLADNGDLDDLVVSNNGDMQKIIATVAQVIVTFLGAYYSKQIYFTGSSPARTRLYRAILNKEIDNWSDVFDIKGVSNSGLVSFPTQVDCDAFLIKRINFDYETKTEEGRHF